MKVGRRGCRTILTIAVVLAVGGVGLRAQAPADEMLYRHLSVGGKEAVTALDSVVKEASTIPAIVLYTAAGVALGEKRLEEAGFLFYIARFRAQFDEELFPPLAKEGNSPLVAFGALQQQWGSLINPALMAEPKTFAKVVTRVKAWKPQVTASYHPGWEYTRKGNAEQALAAIADSLKQFVAGMADFSTLLSDDAYFAAFRVTQAYNIVRGKSRPTQAAYDRAMRAMERIEKEKGIPGIAAQTKK